MIKEKELLLKGINIGIFLALADNEASAKARLNFMESRLSTAKQNKADKESLNRIKTLVEVYKELLDDFSDHKCNSISSYFNDLTIDECNLVYAKITELCLDNAQEVHDEFDYVITEALLRK